MKQSLRGVPTHILRDVERVTRRPQAIRIHHREIRVRGKVFYDYAHVGLVRVSLKDGHYVYEPIDKDGLIRVYPSVWMRIGFHVIARPIHVARGVWQRVRRR